MPHLRLTRFTLWIMAALVAALTAFGPTAAAAHPSQEHRQHVAAVANSFNGARAAVLPSPVKAKALPTSNYAVHFSVPVELQDEHGVCGGACCSGFGCCSSACLNAPARALSARVGMIIRQSMPQRRAPDGVDPSAQLRPPRLFA